MEQNEKKEKRSWVGCCTWTSCHQAGRGAVWACLNTAQPKQETEANFSDILYPLPTPRALGHKYSFTWAESLLSQKRSFCRHLLWHITSALKPSVVMSSNSVPSWDFSMNIIPNSLPLGHRRTLSPKHQAQRHFVPQLQGGVSHWEPGCGKVNASY